MISILVPFGTEFHTKLFVVTIDYEEQPLKEAVQYGLKLEWVALTCLVKVADNAAKCVGNFSMV